MLHKLVDRDQIQHLPRAASAIDPSISQEITVIEIVDFRNPHLTTCRLVSLEGSPTAGGFQFTGTKPSQYNAPSKARSLELTNWPTLHLLPPVLPKLQYPDYNAVSNAPIALGSAHLY